MKRVGAAAARRVDDLRRRRDTSARRRRDGLVEEAADEADVVESEYARTDVMPISRQARAMRTAISPRLGTSIVLIMELHPTAKSVPIAARAF